MPSAKKTSKSAIKEAAPESESELQGFLRISEKWRAILDEGNAAIVLNFGIISTKEEKGAVKCYMAFPDEFAPEIAKKLKEGDKQDIEFEIEKEGIAVILKNVDKMFDLAGLKTETQEATPGSESWRQKIQLSESKDIRISEEWNAALDEGKAKIIPSFDIIANEEEGIMKCYMAFPDKLVAKIDKTEKEGHKQIFNLELEERGITVKHGDKGNASDITDIKRDETKPDTPKKTNAPKNNDYMLYS